MRDNSLLGLSTLCVTHHFTPRKGAICSCIYPFICGSKPFAFICALAFTKAFRAEVLSRPALNRSGERRCSEEAARAGGGVCNREPLFCTPIVASR